MSFSSSHSERSKLLATVNRYRKSMMINVVLFFSSTLIFIYTIFDNFHKPYAFYCYFGLMAILVVISILLSHKLKLAKLKEHDYLGFKSSHLKPSFTQYLRKNWGLYVPIPLYILFIKLGLIDEARISITGFYIMKFLLIFMVASYFISVLSIISPRINYAFFAKVVFFDSSGKKIFDNKNHLIGTIGDDFYVNQLTRIDIPADFSKWKFEQELALGRAPALVKCLSVTLSSWTSEPDQVFIFPHSTAKLFSERAIIAEE